METVAASLRSLRMKKRNKEQERAYRSTTEWKIKHKALIAERGKHAQEVIRTVKSVPCTDCKQRYPHYVMEFDHVRGIKRYNIANAGQGSAKTFIDELAKCDVVCGNCHNARTWFRKRENG